MYKVYYGENYNREVGAESYMDALRLVSMFHRRGYEHLIVARGKELAVFDVFRRGVPCWHVVLTDEYHMGRVYDEASSYHARMMVRDGNAATYYYGY